MIILMSNGAQKTMPLDIITGILQHVRGKIIFDGEHIPKVPAYERSKTGILLIPEKIITIHNYGRYSKPLITEPYYQARIRER